MQPWGPSGLGGCGEEAEPARGEREEGDRSSGPQGEISSLCQCHGGHVM